MDNSFPTQLLHSGWTWLVAAFITVIILLALKRKPKTWFYSVISAASLWGIVLFIATPPILNPEAWHSLAEAAIIAALLAMTVDRYVKERILHEVTSDVSKYLIGYRLPEQLQDRLRSIMQTTWIRRTFEIRLRLSEPSEEETELDVAMNFQVQNITSETQEYLDSVSFSKFELFHVLELRCDSPTTTYHLEGNDIQTQQESGKIRHAGNNVKIPPASESTDEFRFSGRYKMKHPTSSRESFTFTQSTIGAVVEITDCPASFVFHLSPAPDTTAHNRWTYNRLFLPGEQITIQWEKKPEPGEARFQRKPEVAS